MGAAGLHDAVKLRCLGAEGPGQSVQHGVERFERQEGADAHGRREDVVGRLAIVDMVVGMDFGILPELAAKNLIGPVGDDFVGVHVQADAGAGLENIHHELGIPLAVDHFLRGLNDGVGALVFDQAERLVGLGCSVLHHAESTDQQRMCPHAGDRVILNRTHRLRAVIGALRHFDKPE